MNGQHPSEMVLALYASSDLEWRDRIRAGFHVRTCTRCNAKVEAYRGDRSLRAEGAKSMPLPANWDALAEEMTANIRLGLEAGECVELPGRKRTLIRFDSPVRPNWYWKPAAGILASMALVAVAFVSSQSEVFTRVWNAALHGVNEAPGVVLESSANGIEVRRGSRSTMRLLVGSQKPEQVSVNLGGSSADGSVRAQYVDDDSLQVTVTNVYAQ